jgi:hypothetical protein
VEWVN